MAPSGHASGLAGPALDLQVLIDSAPALIHTGLPDGNLDFFNQSWLKYVGLRLEDLQGWKWTASIHPDDVAGILEKWRECVATGEPFEYETRELGNFGDGEVWHHQDSTSRHISPSLKSPAQQMLSGCDLSGSDTKARRAGLRFR